MERNAKTGRRMGLRGRGGGPAQALFLALAWTWTSCLFLGPEGVHSQVLKDRYVLGVCKEGSTLGDDASALVEHLTSDLQQDYPGVTFSAELVSYAGQDFWDHVGPQAKYDLVLCPSTVLSCLEQSYGSTGLATLSFSHGNEATDGMGAVIIAKAGSPISTLSDLRGKVLQSGPTKSPSFLAAWYETRKEGFLMFQQLKQLRVSNTDEPAAVVQNVLNGTVDAGIVPTGALEEMIERGDFAWFNVKVLNPQPFVWKERVPTFAMSTNLIPEWGMSVVHPSRMPIHLQKEITHSLFEINSTHLSAVQNGYLEWHPFASNSRVFEMQKTLNLLTRTEDGRSVCKTAIDVFSEVQCSPGYYLRPIDQVIGGCQAANIPCPLGSTCLCSPCEFVAEVEVSVLGSTVAGFLDQGGVGDAVRCRRLRMCATIQQRDVVTFEVRDYTAREGLNITWELHLDDMQGRPLELLTGNVTLNASDRGQYFFNFSVAYVGLPWLSVSVDGEPTEQSPIIVRVIDRDCGLHRAATRLGECVCDRSSFEVNGECEDITIVAVSVVCAVGGAMILGALVFLRIHKLKRSCAWHIKLETLHFTDPPELLGSGSFAIVYKAEYRGCHVAVKQMQGVSKKKRNSHSMGQGASMNGSRTLSALQKAARGPRESLPYILSNEAVRRASAESTRRLQFDAPPVTAADISLRIGKRTNEAQAEQDLEEGMESNENRSEVASNCNEGSDDCKVSGGDTSCNVSLTMRDDPGMGSGGGETVPGAATRTQSAERPTSGDRSTWQSNSGDRGAGGSAQGVGGLAPASEGASDGKSDGAAPPADLDVEEAGPPGEEGGGVRGSAPMPAPLVRTPFAFPPLAESFRNFQSFSNKMFSSRKLSVASVGSLNRDGSADSSQERGGSTQGFSQSLQSTGYLSWGDWFYMFMGFSGRKRRVFEKEMRVLANLRHKNIVTVMGAVLETSQPMLVMEWMELGSLHSILQNEMMALENEVLFPILLDVVRGLRFLHESVPEIIHGDIKSRNILVDGNYRAKVSDLGLCTKKLTKKVGTVEFMAPELLSGYVGEISVATDVYSFGIMLYEVFSKKDPYETHRDKMQLIRDVIAGHRPPVPEGIDPRMNVLMCKCWSQISEERPAMKDIDKELRGMEAGDINTYILSLKKDGQDKKQHTSLLSDVFPEHIVKQLLAGQKVQPEYKDSVTIFFSDIVGFTNISSTLPPQKVADMLDRLYTVFDNLAQDHEVFKVETIGDAWMGVTNLVKNQHNHAERIALFALDVVSAARQVPIDKDDLTKGTVNIRVGFHTGPVVANIVGKRNPRYCLFGDTVNTASRMESNSEALRIHCSKDAATSLQNNPGVPGRHAVRLQSRGIIEIKGKGPMNTFWILRPNDDGSNSGMHQLPGLPSFSALNESGGDTFDRTPSGGATAAMDKMKGTIVKKLFRWRNKTGAKSSEPMSQRSPVSTRRGPTSPKHDPVSPKHGPASPPKHSRWRSLTPERVTRVRGDGFEHMQPLEPLPSAAGHVRRFQNTFAMEH